MPIDLFKSSLEKKSAIPSCTAGTGMLSKKQIAALKNPKIATLEKQHIAIKNQTKIANMIGGEEVPDNNPMDVILKTGKYTHGIEVKTVFKGAEKRVYMRRDSRLRKEKWVSETKNRTANIIAIDDETNKIYYYDKFGAPVFNTMTEVENKKQLIKLINREMK